MDAKVCLIGKGHVGTCFLKLLKEKKEDFKKRFDFTVKVVAIVEIDGALIDENGINLDEVVKIDKNFRDLPYWKKDVKAKDLFGKLEINVCVEATWTNPDTGEPALSHIADALNNNIDVISSNKGPFYLQYKKIHELAKKKNRIIKYEATVASATPALTIRNYLLGTEIVSIRAILNGTTNYILSRMSSEGVSFEIALKEAQELGYAEANPKLDIEGYDSGGKLVILANELLGWTKSIKDVKITGLGEITPQALELAKGDGYVIKYLAIAENNTLIVEPRLIERSSPLNISGTLNVIEINTKYAGPIILIGRGAGGFEAATAIINDLVGIAFDRNYAHE